MASSEDSSAGEPRHFDKVERPDLRLGPFGLRGNVTVTMSTRADNIEVEDSQDQKDWLKSEATGDYSC